MKVLWRSKWLSVEQVTAHDDVVVSADEVLVIATDDSGALLFVEEPVPAFGGTQLFLPSGAVEPGEDVLETAQRELREETGFAAHTLTAAGTLRPWPKYLRVTSHIVLASGLYASPLKPDEPHPLILHRRTRADIAALIDSGALTDARIIAALSLPGVRA